MQLFEEIYKQNYDKILNFLIKLTDNHALSEDLAQETFLQAFRCFDKYNGSCEMYTWLVSIAKHMYYRHLRKNKLMLHSSNLDVIIDTYRSHNPEDNPDEALDKSIIRSAVVRVIQKLPDKYRDVVLLRIYGEMPFSEVAASLGISENSAKVLYCRAKKMLKEELEDEVEL